VQTFRKHHPCGGLASFCFSAALQCLFLALLGHSQRWRQSKGLMRGLQRLDEGNACIIPALCAGRGRWFNWRLLHPCLGPGHRHPTHHGAAAGPSAFLSRSAVCSHRRSKRHVAAAAFPGELGSWGDQIRPDTCNMDDQDRPGPLSDLDQEWQVSISSASVRCKVVWCCFSSDRRSRSTDSGDLRTFLQCWP
jgi:hypothetical protein